MADELKPFRSTATIYVGGGGLPFPPGTPMQLPASHVDALTAIGLNAPDAPKSKPADKGQGGN